METSNPIDTLLSEIQEAGGSDLMLDIPAARAELEETHAVFNNLPIKVLSILGGFIATLAFLGFLALGGLFNSQGAMGTLGFVFIAGAIGLQKVAKHIATDTALITIYITGYAMVLFAFGSEHSRDIQPLAMMLIAIASIVFADGFMLVLLAVIIFNASVFSFIPIHHLEAAVSLPIIFTGIGLILLTVYEAKIITLSEKTNRRYKAAQMGFFVSFAIGLLSAALDHNFHLGLDNLWLVSVFNALALLVLIYKASIHFNIENKVTLAVICLFGILFIATTFYAPYVSGGVLLLFLAFHYGYKTQIGIGIILLIYFISQYYYDLNCSLLVKSGILFSSGLIFLAAWLFFYRQLKPNEKV